MSNSKTIQNPIYESPVFLETISATEAVVGNQGGSWSAKTFSILQVVFFLTLATKYRDKSGRLENIVSTVVAQDVPNLKKGAIKDFTEITDIIVQSFPKDCRHFFDRTYNKTDRIVRFKNDSTIQFSSFKSAQGAKGSRRHFLFLNEAQGVPYPIAEQLMMRTKIRTFTDYNPDAPFWFHHKFIGKEGVKMIYSNLTHNKFIPDKVKREMLAKAAENEQYKNVYVLGKTGSTEGLVFKNVVWVNSMPKTYKKESYGMDFGYTNDPTTLVRVVLHNGNLYAECLIYEKGMKANPKNKKYFSSSIVKRLEQLMIAKKTRIYCDNETETIFNIREGGYRRAMKAKKGAGSVRMGCANINQYGTLYLVDNLHWRGEQIGYKYEKNNLTGEYTNEPDQSLGLDHIWDALRYAMQGIKGAALKLGRLHN